jgi:hypothetical protein
MRVATVAALSAVLSLGFFVEPIEAHQCPNDAVVSGTVCMDKYESSVWYVPPTRTNLIARIKAGTVTLANLTSPAAVAAGVQQLGLSEDDLAAAGCAATGNGCLNVYAVSIRDVRPATFLTWFQAVAAARNSRKRLPTNQEWQAAALGTPDGFPCIVGGADVANTGSNKGCVSDVGAFDMVGNVWERVAEWAKQASCTLIPNWPPTFGDDVACFSGPTAGSALPEVISRGGDWSMGTDAGVFAVLVSSAHPDSSFGKRAGFRCAR